MPDQFPPTQPSIPPTSPSQPGQKGEVPFEIEITPQTSPSPQTKLDTREPQPTTSESGMNLDEFMNASSLPSPENSSPSDEGDSQSTTVPSTPSTDEVNSLEEDELGGTPTPTEDTDPSLAPSLAAAPLAGNDPRKVFPNPNKELIDSYQDLNNPAAASSDPSQASPNIVKNNILQRFRPQIPGQAAPFDPKKTVNQSAPSMVGSAPSMPGNKPSDKEGDKSSGSAPKENVLQTTNRYRNLAAEIGSQNYLAAAAEVFKNREKYAADAKKSLKTYFLLYATPFLIILIVLAAIFGNSLGASEAGLGDVPAQPGSSCNTSSLGVSSSFDPTTLISNDIFTDRSMGVAEIQAYLESKHSVLAHISPDRLGNGANNRTAAQIIYDATGPDNKRIKFKHLPEVPLNPRVLMTTLQKESSLITATTSSSKLINGAGGYTPDGKHLSNSGFTPQVYLAAATLRVLYQLAQQNIYPAPAGLVGQPESQFGINKGPENMKNAAPSDPDADDSALIAKYGNKTIVSNITNAATAALYQYTPFVYTGNYHFWNDYKTLFGSGTASSTTTVAASSCKPSGAGSAVSVGSIPGGYTVCIDPGHGGSNPGSGPFLTGILERQVTVDVGNRLRTELQKNNINVIMTHTSPDDGPDNLARGTFCNQAKLALHLHTNAGNGSAQGFSFYVPDAIESNSTQHEAFPGTAGHPSMEVVQSSEAAAEKFHAAFAKVIGSDLKDNNTSRIFGDTDTNDHALGFSETSQIPTITIEMFFGDNNHDASWYKQAANQTKLVNALVQGTLAVAHATP